MSFKGSYADLTQGIDTLYFKGSSIPCELLLVGDKAFPLLVSNSGQVLIAASHYGKGRIVAISHESYLNSPKFSKLLLNAVHWLKPSADALVGVQSTFDSLVKTFSDHGIKVQSTCGFLESFGVYCMDAYNANQKKELIAFVKNGGGLLIAGQALDWASKNGTETVCFEFPGNQVINVSGIYFTSNGVEGGVLPISKEIPPCPLLVGHGIDITKDMRYLLNGVTHLNINNGGEPSQLLVHGLLAFPVGLDDSHRSFLAAAHYSKGRVVVAGHETQLNSACLKTFLLNAVSWLDAGRKGKIGMVSGLKGLLDLLNENKLPSEISDLIPSLSVYCCQSYSDCEAQKIHEFVAEGGGLLIGGHAWWWARQHPGQYAAADYPGNKILNTFGISILSQTLLAKNYKAMDPEDAPKVYHFRRALSKFLQESGGKQDTEPSPASRIKKLGQDCAEILKLSTEGSAAVHSVHQILKDLLHRSGVPEVSKQKPIQHHSNKSLLIGLATSLYEHYPKLFEVYRHPKLSDLSDVTLSIDANNKGAAAWRSTGLYLHPKQNASMVFPPSAIGAQLKVQIGCHTDNLSGKEDDFSKRQQLFRPPTVTKVYQVKSEKMTISTLWGGLIYILVPGRCQLGLLSITVTGAVRAPFYKHGETTDSDWLETVGHYPAPWAEFATENIILTVPAEYALAVEKPSTLISLWDRMMAAVAELAAIPFPFLRPERIVADVQISGGWMHAGYPIMAHTDSAKELTNFDLISGGIWGPIHELGHNQQCWGWNISPNTTEATCNLWSVYVSEKVLGIPRSRAHGDLHPECREKHITNYLEKGAKLQDWTLWAALETYLQLQEAYGWAPFIQLFSDYQTMTDIKDENPSKMNLWAEKFSNQVKKNLAPFFKMWGWPIKDSVSAKLSSLPEWEENPMKK
ncbi:TRPM8 channel-associated factor homolog [Lissotriton helveticus]